nr:MAG TPA: hypothetical protein [Herelleviridae sp.]
MFLWYHKDKSKEANKMIESFVNYMKAEKMY